MVLKWYFLLVQYFLLLRVQFDLLLLFTVIESMLSDPILSSFFMLTLIFSCRLPLLNMCRTMTHYKLSVKLKNVLMHCKLFTIFTTIYSKMFVDRVCTYCHDRHGCQTLKLTHGIE